jgi:hypothetical protein
MTQLAARFMPTQEISPTRTAVERIAAFTHAARPENLTPRTRRLYKRNILDSLGCAIAALPAAPFSALREQAAEYRAPGNCTLIAGGKSAPDHAAFFNTALIRYVDMLDSYMAPGGVVTLSNGFSASGQQCERSENHDTTAEQFQALTQRADAANTGSSETLLDFRCALRNQVSKAQWRQLFPASPGFASR